MKDAWRFIADTWPFLVGLLVLIVIVVSVSVSQANAAARKAEQRDADCIELLRSGMDAHQREIVWRLLCR